MGSKADSVVKVLWTNSTNFKNVHSVMSLWDQSVKKY